MKSSALTQLTFRQSRWYRALSQQQPPLAEGSALQRAAAEGQLIAAY